MKYSTLPAIIFILIAPFSSVNQASENFSYPLVQFAQNTNQDLNSAIKSIKQKTGGRILSSKKIIKNGHKIFKIKVLLPSGKVQIFTITAQ